MASAATTSSSKSPHVLAIPFPAQNQLLPFLEFSCRLASHGISITILTTRSHSPPLQHLLERAKTESLDIRPLYIPLPSNQMEMEEDIHWKSVLLLPSRDFNNSKDESHRCLQWLDSQKAESVLYVCLGNHSVLSDEQTMELACELEALDKPFIWVNNSTTAIPQRFEERVDKNRSGFIIRGRAPQHLILSHHSVGGFLTHCDWNSALQSIAMGVPMITWPISGDQFCNSLLLSELLKIAVQLCEGENGVPNREGLHTAVAQIMEQDCGGEQNRKAKEIG